MQSFWCTHTHTHTHPHAQTHTLTYTLTHAPAVLTQFTLKLSLTFLPYFFLPYLFISLSHFCLSNTSRPVCILSVFVSLSLRVFFPSCLHNWSFLMTGCLIKEKFHQFPQLSLRISAQKCFNTFLFHLIFKIRQQNFTVNFYDIFLIVTIETETTFHRDSSKDNSQRDNCTQAISSLPSFYPKKSSSTLSSSSPSSSSS